ncbi:hypothetical protein [Bradyrhizobium japonicum]|uniref:hypothetical protein n=1 Tax=Bradyrhizobium japonicum TaxID=375 RepID=UPI0006936454|nr:hypothetical protein [Bradyrhizobium japonicum]
MIAKAALDSRWNRRLRTPRRPYLPTQSRYRASPIWRDLAEIGQLLRHENHDTTRIYAKVDIDALRTLSLPWPGGVK